MNLIALFSSTTTKPDAAVFIVCAILALLGSLGVVLQKNPVHCALALVATLFSVAVMFVSQGAQFLAAVQVIVYAGAVVVLFLFVIMLIGVDRLETLGGEKFKGQRIWGALLSIVVLLELFILAYGHWATGPTGQPAQSGDNVKSLARAIFGQYEMPFELTSLLLIVAVIGAVILARKRSTEISTDESSEVQS